MSAATTLHGLLTASARRRPSARAVLGPGGGETTFEELDVRSDRLRDRLVHAGVGRGDRVGVYLTKSVDAVVAIFGILKAGAAYVPVDVEGPIARNAFVLCDCSVGVVIVNERFAGPLERETGRLGNEAPVLLSVEGRRGCPALAERIGDLPSADTVRSQPDDLAYILYTSGSTGKPKGVMLSHGNAMSFIEWCSQTFHPDDQDRFASHAPFHFDLSVLDVFLSIKHGACLVLIAEETRKNPAALATRLADAGVSVLYATPTVLTLLTQFGRLERHNWKSLRLVLFAGEVFPLKHLRALKRGLPGARYYNLYGPTETNVCTFYEVPKDIPQTRTEPVPIGHCCRHLEARVLDKDGGEVQDGTPGELCISGAQVMQGYWNRPELNRQAFLHDGSDTRWYRTGDVVSRDPKEGYRFLGRRDRMVKRRGCRVELGEIEASLCLHPSIAEVAVVATEGDDQETLITAFVDSGAGPRPSMIELKAFCAKTLPAHLAPDRFVLVERLPKTSTSKTDYVALKESLS